MKLDAFGCWCSSGCQCLLGGDALGYLGGWEMLLGIGALSGAAVTAPAWSVPKEAHKTRERGDGVWRSW